MITLLGSLYKCRTAEQAAEVFDAESCDLLVPRTRAQCIVQASFRRTRGAQGMHR